MALVFAAAMSLLGFCAITIQFVMAMVESYILVAAAFIFPVGRVAVIGQEIVRPGDQLQIGPVIFRVEYEASLTAEPLAVAAAGASAESIPVAEEELETERHPQPGEPVPEADEVMAVGEESVIDLDYLAWRPPENADIRDILSKMEDK